MKMLCKYDIIYVIDSKGDEIMSDSTWNNELLFDSNERITIPFSILNYVGLGDSKEVAICKYYYKAEKVLLIRDINNIKDCEVIGFASADEKRRYIIPAYLRKGFSKIEFFIVNEELLLLLKAG